VEADVVLDEVGVVVSVKVGDVVLVVLGVFVPEVV
jgi:hypothetical protein